MPDYRTPLPSAAAPPQKVLGDAPLLPPQAARAKPLKKPAAAAGVPGGPVRRKKVLGRSETAGPKLLKSKVGGYVPAAPQNPKKSYGSAGARRGSGGGRGIEQSC